MHLSVRDAFYISPICAQVCQNSKSVIFQEKLLKVLKCYNFLWVQRRHSCSPAVSFANCVMTLYLLKLHLQTFLSIPITQKCQILSRDTLVANERYYHKWKIGLHVEYFSVSLHFNITWNFLYKFSKKKKLKYQISWKSVQWEGIFFSFPFGRKKKQAWRRY